MDVHDYIFKEIQERAYDMWEFRCDYNVPGTAEEDWLAAEKEILAWYRPGNHFNKDKL